MNELKALLKGDAAPTNGASDGVDLDALAREEALERWDDKSLPKKERYAALKDLLELLED